MAWRWEHLERLQEAVSSTDEGSRETQEGAHDPPRRPAVCALWQADAAPEQLDPRPTQVAHCGALPVGLSPSLPAVLSQTSPQ